ncbi:MAG: hypothetical protein IPO68_08805 [Chitinophagaceae bacterium]|nr:hypothetical protein [Chitinophagaceae bacterium]
MKTGIFQRKGDRAARKTTEGQACKNGSLRMKRCSNLFNVVPGRNVIPGLTRNLFSKEKMNEREIPGQARYDRLREMPGQAR